jgi:hypothetical protein
VARRPGDHVPRLHGSRGRTTAHINSTLWVAQDTDPYNNVSIEDGIYDGWIEPDGYNYCSGFAP